MWLCRGRDTRQRRAHRVIHVHGSILTIVTADIAAALGHLVFAC